MKGVARRLLLLVFLALIIVVPRVSYAQVVINEAMYDPAGPDSGQEWIELFNAGISAVDLTKWTFNDGSNTTKHAFNVPPKNGGIGSITIQPGAYLIVADDAAAFAAANPSVQNVIDSTMSMPDPNAGVSVTLTLFDDQKNSENTLTYTAGTNADNKGDSVQRVTPSGSDVIVAAPTPFAVNATMADTSSSSDSSGNSSDATTTAQSDQSTQTQKTTSAPASSYVAPPAPSIYADAGFDRTVIVGADTEFDARAYNKTQDIVDNVRFLWNFGDGATAEGAAVLHHFSYPGRYAVVLDIAENKLAASDETVITAEPAKLAFKALPDSGVEIDNLAARDLDLSGWLVRAGAGLFPALFALPPHSVILSGSSMRITETTLGFAAGAEAELQYPNGVEVLQAGQNTGDASALPVPPMPTSSTPAQVNQVVSYSVSNADNASYSVPEKVPADNPADSPTVDTSTTAQTAAAGATGGGWSGWWVAVIGLAIAAGGALIAAQYFGKGEWDIIEEKPEAE